MAGSEFGRIFKIMTWGESHGKALGVVIDGCPAGLQLSEEDIQVYLDRRRPGRNSISTPRNEADRVEILSGVFEGVTTGTPISLMIRNETQRSGDYGNIATVYRPGHADYSFDAKYGIRDYRGGGRSSGRETAGRVAAGAIALKILKEMGIEVCAYTSSIGEVSIDKSKFDPVAILQTPTCMPDREADIRAVELINNLREQCDSIGGSIECIIRNVPAGIGDPVFEKLNANLGKAIMSIGAVKAVEIGDGMQVSEMKGSEDNDAFIFEDGQYHKRSNHAGGIMGGISDGSDITLKAYFKATPSISQPQATANKNGDNLDITIKGRHDPVIVPRAVVVLESMVALTILDAMMVNMSSRLDALKDFYTE